MKKNYKKISILTLFTPLYFLSVVFLEISFIGYWTDIICFTILIYCSFRVLRKVKKGILKNIFYALNVLYSLILLLSLVLTLLTTSFRAENFYFIKVDDGLFNAYVSRGFSFPSSSDHLSVQETSIFCPFLEKRVFSEDRFWDFEVIDTDGSGTDSEKIETLKLYIKNKIDENK